MTAAVKPYRVLSLDGGGMRGLYTATVLDHLGRRFGATPDRNPYDLATGYDLIVGTSTGGILAAALASGLSPDAIIAFYLKHGPSIFTSPMPKGGVGLFWWLLRHWNTSGNSQAALKAALEGTFGEMTLKQLWEKRRIALCISTVNLITQQPRVFKTPHNISQQKFRDNNWRISDICLASSAAPVYLPIARLRDPDTPTNLHAFVDGGLWANNPTLVGLIEALEMAGENQPIEIVSVGTCSPAVGRSLGTNTGDWGLRQWRVGVNVTETSMEASARATDYMAQFLAKHLRTNCRILRLQQSQPSIAHQEDIALDRTTPRFVEAMTQLGRQDADEIFGKFNREPESPYRLLKDIFTATQPAQGT